MKERKPNGYWTNWENVEREIGDLLVRHSLDTLPGKRTLSNMGYSSLAASLSRHGGARAVRERLQLEQVRQAQGTWNNSEYVVAQARQILRKHKKTELPNQDWLIKNGHSDFVNGVRRHHGGMGELRALLGHPKKEKPKKYWDMKRIVTRANKIMKEHGLSEFPTSVQLKELGHADFVASVQNKIQGGLSTLKERLGYKSSRVSSGEWKKYEFTKSYAQGILEDSDLSELPTEQVLRDLGYGSFCAAVQKYHGGLTSFRSSLGHANNRVKRGLWQNEEYIVEKALEAMREMGAEALPSVSKLEREGYGGLGSAIIRNYGGIVNFRNLLAERMGQPTEREDLEGLLDEYVSGGET